MKKKFPIKNENFTSKVEKEFLEMIFLQK